MKTAFLALNFHLKKTKSSQFFIDILQQNIPDFHVININNAWYDIPRIKPDTVIIWQHIFSPKEIDSWGVKNVIIIPMYDACPHTIDFWNQYKKYKVFCFSNTLFTFLKDNGFNTFHSQYFIEPLDKKITKEKLLSFFLWERSKKVNWPLIKKLIGQTKVDSFQYHNPASQPSDEDVNQYTITVSNWFETKEEYFSILNKSTVYLAPRESEGIGLSFIEALARGCLVIAYDAPTMNEYIEHGITGYLFNEHTNNSFDFSIDKVQKIRENALINAAKGWEKWVSSIPTIIDFINTPLQSYTPKPSLNIIIKKRLKAELRFLLKGKD